MLLNRTAYELQPVAMQVSSGQIKNVFLDFDWQVVPVGLPKRQRLHCHGYTRCALFQLVKKRSSSASSTSIISGQSFDLSPVDKFIELPLSSNKSIEVSPPFGKFIELPILLCSRSCWNRLGFAASQSWMLGFRTGNGPRIRNRTQRGREMPYSEHTTLDTSRTPLPKVPLLRILCRFADVTGLPSTVWDSYTQLPAGPLL